LLSALPEVLPSLPSQPAKAKIARTASKRGKSVFIFIVMRIPFVQIKPRRQYHRRAIVVCSVLTGNIRPLFKSHTNREEDFCILCR
jgi:hypothetical protein